MSPPPSPPRPPSERPAGMSLLGCLLSGAGAVGCGALVVVGLIFWVLAAAESARARPTPNVPAGPRTAQAPVGAPSAKIAASALAAAYAGGAEAGDARYLGKTLQVTGRVIVAGRGAEPYVSLLEEGAAAELPSVVVEFDDATRARFLKPGGKGLGWVGPGARVTVVGRCAGRTGPDVRLKRARFVLR